MCVQLASWSTEPLRFMHVVAYGWISFFLQTSNIQSHVWTTFSLPMYASTDILGCFRLENNAALNIDVCKRGKHSSCVCVLDSHALTMPPLDSLCVWVVHTSSWSLQRQLGCPVMPWSSDLPREPQTTPPTMLRAQPCKAARSSFSCLPCC